MCIWFAFFTSHRSCSLCIHCDCVCDMSKNAKSCPEIKIFSYCIFTRSFQIINCSRCQHVYQHYHDWFCLRTFLKTGFQLPVKPIHGMAFFLDIISIKLLLFSRWEYSQCAEAFVESVLRSRSVHTEWKQTQNFVFMTAAFLSDCHLNCEKNILEASDCFSLSQCEERLRYWKTEAF